MPLDFITEVDFEQAIAPIPDHLDFEVEFEDTKVHDKRYVVNARTGEYIGIVGDKFNCADHTAFFTGVQDAMTEHLSDDQLVNAQVTWKSARKNAWALMDIVLPNVTTTITTDKHETNISQRIIALHGVDGSCSNMVFFGAIDFFCTNGMIRGEHDKVKRKNTTFFSMDTFIDELLASKSAFDQQTEQLQKMANTPLHVNVPDLLQSIVKSEKKAEKMFTLYNQEVSTRGRNVFALYSAFTNYATYADERNGFLLRQTHNDNDAVNMFKREHEVATWIETKQFKELIAA